MRLPGLSKSTNVKTFAPMVRAEVSLTNFLFERRRCADGGIFDQTSASTSIGPYWLRPA
jgi:hypothetical protein